jgi:hypothetical protein
MVSGMELFELSESIKANLFRLQPSTPSDDTRTYLKNACTRLNRIEIAVALRTLLHDQFELQFSKFSWDTELVGHKTLYAQVCVIDIDESVGMMKGVVVHIIYPPECPTTLVLRWKLLQPNQDTWISWHVCFPLSIEQMQVYVNLLFISFFEHGVMDVGKLPLIYTESPSTTTLTPPSSTKNSPNVSPSFIRRIFK